MDLKIKICGWDGCQALISETNPKTGRLVYYCPDHQEARKKHKKTYYEKNREDFNQKCLQRYHNLRKLVLAMYGGKCACCGEKHETFLALDHVNGGGQKHRHSRGGNYGVYKDALLANDPTEFRVLCHNCNFAIYQCGLCPHDFS